MDRCIEPDTVTVLEVGNDGDESAEFARRSESTSPRSRRVVRVRLRLLGGGSLEREAGPQPMEGDAESTSCSEIVFDLDLGELLASVDATSGNKPDPIYRFGDCELSTGRRSLIRGGREVHLRPKVFLLLVHLLENRGRALSRDELCEAVWNGRCIGNATIDSTVQALRRAVGDDGVEQRVVQTLSGYGYRFAASVEVGTAEGERLRSPSHRPPRQASLHVVGGRTAALHDALRASA